MQAVLTDEQSTPPCNSFYHHHHHQSIETLSAVPDMPSSSSDYSYKPSGSLRFKGGESVGGSGGTTKKGKKTKSKSKTKSSTSVDVRHDGKEGMLNVGDGDGDGEPDAVKISGRSMTDAERRFEEARKRRMKDRISEKAKQSHKDRVDQFNKSLADRTEHNDMLTVAGH